MDYRLQIDELKKCHLERPPGRRDLVLCGFCNVSLRFLTFVRNDKEEVNYIRWIADYELMKLKNVISNGRQAGEIFSCIEFAML